MRTILTTILSLVASGIMCAQVQLTPYLPDNLLLKSESAYNILLNKLNTIITTNGLATADAPERFILTCNCTELSTSIVPGAPVKYSCVLELTLYIGDGISGMKFSSTSLQTKGVGNSENKAYINAINNVACKSDNISNFIKTGISRIIDYYEQQKDALFSNVNICLSNGDFNQAIYLLSLVPEECSYFQEAQHLLIAAYDKMIDSDNQQLLLQARGLWASNQDIASANESIEILNRIRPDASCYKDAQALIKSIQADVKKIKQREWVEQTKEQQHKREMEALEAKAQIERDRQSARLKETAIKSATQLQMQRIQAAREVAKAYVLSRPRVVYHVHGWY